MNESIFRLIPWKYRKYVYAGATIALFAIGVWRMSDGDIMTFLGSLVFSIVTAMAHGNTTPEAPKPPSDPTDTPPN